MLKYVLLSALIASVVTLDDLPDGLKLNGVDLFDSLLEQPATNLVHDDVPTNDVEMQLQAEADNTWGGKKKGDSRRRRRRSKKAKSTTRSPTTFDSTLGKLPKEVARSESDLRAAAWHAKNVYNTCDKLAKFENSGEGYSVEAPHCFTDGAEDMEDELQWGLVGDGVKAAGDAMKEHVVNPAVKLVKEHVVDPVSKHTVDAYNSASEWFKTIFQPEGTLLYGQTGVERYIAVNQEKKTAVVAFRGSEEGQDWVSNVDIKMNDWAFAGDHCYVHGGFYNQYAAQRQDLVDNMQTLYDSGIKHFIVTGHSLGGALAQLGAYDLGSKFSGAKVDLYTFGSPRVSPSKGNAGLPDGSKFQTYLSKVVKHQVHITYKEDLVPCLPDTGLWDTPTSGVRHYIGGSGASSWEKGDQCKGFSDQASTYKDTMTEAEPIGDHDVEHYCKAVSATCPALQSAI